MKRVTGIISFLLVLLPVNAAFAVDGEYVTYGGHDATVAAFQYIALFFANVEYGGLIFTIATIGLAVGTFNAFATTSGRDGNRITFWVITFLFGAGLFTAFVLPKGRVFVYDPVVNETTTVVDVPDGIVLIANLASNFQETAVAIADTASPRLYEDTANGSIFDLIRKTFTSNNPIADEFVWQSTKSYFTDCVSLATRMPLTGLTTDELRNSSTDLVASFAKANLVSLFTTTFSAAAPGGTTATCNAAWASLQPQITNVATYTAFEDALCSDAGFDPGSVTQRARCTALMDEVPTLFAGAGDRYSYLRGAALAQAMEEAMADVNPERAIAAETSRRYIEQSAGVFSVAQEYGPFIRSAFFAAAISTLPLLFLFLMTPFFGSVLRLAVGFFAFVALWSVIDVGIAQVAHGIAVGAFEDVARHNMSYTAFMLTPPASVKALTVFGASRFIAVAFAGIFVVTVFKLSGASFASLTSPITGPATSAADGASNSVLNPISRDNTSAGLATAGGRSAALANDPNGTFRAWQDHSQGNLQQTAGSVAGGRSAAAAQGTTYGHARFGSGVVEGAGAVGAAAGVASAGGASLDGLTREGGAAVNATAIAAATRSNVQGRSAVFNAQNLKAISEGLAKNGGGTANDHLGRIASIENVNRASTLEAAGGSLETLGNTTRTEVSQRIGSARGAEVGAASQGTTVEATSQGAATLNTVYSAGEARFLDGASSGDVNAIASSGELRRDRQVGWVSGVGSAAEHLGVTPGQASRGAETTSAARSIISANRQAEINQALFGDANAGFSAQAGANHVFPVTPEQAQSLHSQGWIGDNQLAAIGNSGVVSISIDSAGNPAGVRAVSENSAMIDGSTSTNTGVTLNAGDNVGGGTIIAAALDGASGQSVFRAAISGDENFRQQLVADGDSALSNIISQQRLHNEFASNQGGVSAEVAAGLRGEFGTPGFIDFIAPGKIKSFASATGTASGSRSAGEQLSRNDGVSAHAAFLNRELSGLREFTQTDEFRGLPQSDQNSALGAQISASQQRIETYQSDLVKLQGILDQQANDPDLLSNQKNPDDLLDQQNRTNSRADSGQTSPIIGPKGGLNSL